MVFVVDGGSVVIAATSRLMKDESIVSGYNNRPAFAS